jgi:uncharacterized protein
VTVLQANKALVRGFCEAYTAADWTRIQELLTDDFRWKVIASKARQSRMLKDAPVFNTEPGYTKAETLAIFSQTQENVLDGAFTLMVTSMTAEDDRVAAECSSHAVNRENGRVYDNRYHSLFVCRGQQIAEMREYQDTALVLDVFWAVP